MTTRVPSSMMDMSAGVLAAAFTPPVAVVFSATAMAVNCALSNVFTTTLTANVTTAPTLSNPGNGQTINWRLKQDGTGSHTMTWPTAFDWPGGTVPTLSTSANAVDLLVATYFADTGLWLASNLSPAGERSSPS